MAEWKSPPKAKIFEALSAVADGRVHFKGEQQAEVTSSDGKKTYSVEWSGDVSAITSNDNASYWQGYLGYPVIAVLMLQGRISFDRDIATLLAGIPWKQLNKTYRNDYDKAVSHVLKTVELSGSSSVPVVEEVDRIMEQLLALKIGKLPRRKRPPKA